MRLTVQFFSLFCLIAVLMKVGYPADTPPSVLETESLTGMTETNLRQDSRPSRLKTPTRIVDRLKTYWKYPPDQVVDRRMGITWLEYGDHHASFNVDGVCGAVYGNGLERYGIPILAVGDSGSEPD